jgi:ribosomal-protein-serine acetyltransferase
MAILYRKPILTDMPGVEIMLLEEKHAEELFALIDRNRDHLRRWLPWVEATLTAADSAAFIRRSLDQQARQEAVVDGVFLEGRLAGVVSLVRVDLANRSAMIGYWLGEVQQGKGLMTRACQAMIDYAFGEMGLNRLEIKAAPGNSKSLAVAVRLGFSLEGVERQAAWLYDHFEDMVVYSLLRQEWVEEGHARRGGCPPIARPK